MNKNPNADELATWVDESLMSSRLPHRDGPEIFIKQLHLGKEARTLGENVTNTMRDAIIRGKLAPGQPLGQEYLANAFGVSRVPIRECLKQLAAEGLVEVEPHKGAIVSRLSLEELDELYGILWALETMGVRMGIPMLTEENVKEMATVIEQLDKLLDPVDWYRASVSFHRMILAATGWKRCLQIVDECRKNIGRYITDQSFFEQHVSEWNCRNRALFVACKARDAEAAVQALELMRSYSTVQIRNHLKQRLKLEGVRVDKRKR
jgi:DNA-binding GntR family transcriptional regulator